MLSQLQEKKSLIYFASGLRLNGIDNQAQLHATVDAAIRAGVSFWPIDARGLVAQAPLETPRQGSPGNRACIPAPRLSRTTTTSNSRKTRSTPGRRYRRKSTLRQQRSDPRNRTGPAGDRRYYVVGYYTSNTARNGHSGGSRSHSVRMHRETRLRQGYYADKEFANSQQSTKSDNSKMR